MFGFMCGSLSSWSPGRSSGVNRNLGCTVSVPCAGLNPGGGERIPAIVCDHGRPPGPLRHHPPRHDGPGGLCPRAAASDRSAADPQLHGKGPVRPDLECGHAGLPGVDHHPRRYRHRPPLPEVLQPPPAGRTVLVEIIYPGNRIVLDYGDLDDLVLLGAVDLDTGRSRGPEAVPDWPGPVVESFAHPTLADALAAPPRAGREGLVVWFPDADLRVKLKYEEYVRLHRIVTGLNARLVWEGIGDLDALVEPLPDEFHPWVRTVAASLLAEADARAATIEEAYRSIVAGLADGWSRKDFALVASRHPLRGYLFLRLDGRDCRPRLWQDIRPAADWTPSGRVLSEDVA